MANLVADIQKADIQRPTSKSKDNRLGTGSVGAKLVLPVPTDNGYVDLSYTVATQTTYLGWGLPRGFLAS